MSTATLADAELEDYASVIQPTHWWVYLVTGTLWMLFGWVVLTAQSEITTVWAVAVFAGCLFMFFAVGEIATALFSSSWRWWHIALGLVALTAGITAFVWPEQTFFTLAAIVSWYLLVAGTINAALALTSRHENEFWWAMLIVAVAEILIGLWAIGYPGRSVRLLVLWVGATGLTRGLIQIVAGFGMRSRLHAQPVTN